MQFLVFEKNPSTSKNEKPGYQLKGSKIADFALRLSVFAAKHEAQKAEGNYYVYEGELSQTCQGLKHFTPKRLLAAGNIYDHLKG